MLRHGSRSFLPGLIDCGVLAEAVSDARFSEVVGRHFQSNPIAYREPDEMFAHLSGDMREHFVLVIENHSKHRSR